MKKQRVIQIGIILVLAIVFCVIISVYMNSNSKTNMQMPEEQKGEQPSGDMSQSSSSSVETTGATEVADIQTLTGSYETDKEDESVVKVSDGGELTLEDATITKSGDSTNTENSEFYGVNAAVLTTAGSTTTIKNSTILTTAKGDNAVFATGTDAKAYVYNTTINSIGSSSARGLDATYGGYIEADNVTISTTGGSCATLATDRGEGTIIARNSKLSTEGSGSPIVYSTGNITLEDSTGTATGAQMVVVEGKNTATLNNVTLSCSGIGNRNNVDNAGIMIYQSMSGDAGEGTGTFTASNSNLSITSDSSSYTTSPFFFITNTTAVINLENNNLNYGSNILLKSEGTSEWGTSGSNGGDITLNATNQNLVGNIELDELSSIEINLTNDSYLESTINGDNSAKKVILNLDNTSKLKLTGNTYITSLTDSDTTYSNIDFNGYSLYVNGTKIN